MSRRALCAIQGYASILKQEFNEGRLDKTFVQALANMVSNAIKLMRPDVSPW